MNRTTLRRLALGAGGVLVLLLAGAFIFVATFDVNRYKPQIVSAVHERTGRTLRFDGDLGLTLFPRLALRLPRTTLSEPGRDDVFARLQSADAGIAVLPLLRRELQVDGVRIDGLQATVVRRKDGTTNIDDLLNTSGAPAEPGAAPSRQQAAPPTSAGSTTIDRVQLKNADVTWRDLVAGRTVRLSALDLDAGRYAAGRRMPIEANADVAADAPSFLGKASVKAAVEWNDQGGWRGLHDVALTAAGTLNRQPLSIDARVERLIAAADAMDVRALKIVASTGSGGATPAEWQLSAPRIEANAGRATGDRVELFYARRGADPVEAKARIDGVRGTVDRLEATSVKISGTAKSARRTTRFDLTSGLLVDGKARTLGFERAAGEVALEDPAHGAKPLRVALTASGTADLQRETVALQFEGHGDGLAARGKVAVTGFATPRATFDIDADQIDADRYFLTAAPKDAGRGATPAPGAAATPPSGATEDATVDLKGLRSLDAAGSVRIARLRWKDTDINDVRATLKAGGGRLDVAPFSLHVHGGSVTGRAGVDARSNRVSVDGALDGIQLKRLAGTVRGRVALEGSARGSFDLVATGATVGQMKRALNGTARVEVRDGALVGIDLGHLVGSAAAFLQSRGRQSGALDETRRTPFSQLSATIAIRDGVASNDDLKAKSAQLDMSGAGRANLVTDELDYTVRALVIPGPATAQSDLRSLAGMTVPVRITGPIDKPSYSVEWAPIAAELLLKQATGRTGAPAVNQMLEGLGELLRRKK